MTMKSVLDDAPEKARASAKRGGLTQAVLYVIEGQYVTAEAMAERLGVTRKSAVAKYSRVRTLPGPVTWEKLAFTSKQGKR